MKGRSVVKFFLVALLVTYPLFVFLALVVFELPISIVSIGMMIIAIAYFGFFGSKGKRNWSAILLGAMAIAVLITQSEIVLEFYPICLTLIFLFVFGIPLLRGRPIITRFAMMMDDAIETHPGRGILERCCKALNIVWCIHFIISLAINCMIVFGSTLRIWTLYNALISYLVQGLSLRKSHGNLPRSVPYAQGCLHRQKHEENSQGETSADLQPHFIHRCLCHSLRILVQAAPLPGGK